MSELINFTLAEARDAVRAKTVSSVELTKAFCDRLEKLGPQHNALALSLRTSALNGPRRPAPRGPD